MTLKTGEGLSWIFGIALVGVFLAQLASGEVQRQRDIQTFDKAISTQAVAWRTPDQSQWSAERIVAYADSLKAPPASVLGILEIPQLALSVPIYASASDLNMDRGVGHIIGTAAPGVEGNLGIAGHRDGYFRALKDIAIGDELTLRTLTGEYRYTVRETLVVDPPDVEVLDPTQTRYITLVTCYPFYFVGHAPQRFIVRAEIDNYPVIK